RGGWRFLFSPSLRGLADGVRRFDAHLGKLVAERRKDVGNEGRALEAAERADADARRLRIRASRAGANGREVARRGSAPILRQQPRQPRRLLRAGNGGKARAENAERAEQGFLCGPCELSG